MESMTPRQRAVMENITPERPLCYGGEGHWFFDGGRGPRIHASTGAALTKKRWVKLLARKPDDPFWKSTYGLTAEGRKALDEDGAEARLRIHRRIN